MLPWIVLAAGLTGTITALAMQIWMNAIDYPFLISGKPLFGLPANIPITFELTVLFAAITTVIGMWGSNGLPCLYHPVFKSERFRRVTADRFFIVDRPGQRATMSGSINVVAPDIDASAELGFVRVGVEDGTLEGLAGVWDKQS